MARILSALVFLFPAELWAGSLEKDDLFLSGTKMIIGIIAVVGLMLFVYFLNHKGVGFLKKVKASRINILEMRHVGGKKMLCLVEVNGQELLLGLGNERIDFLCQLTENEAVTDFKNEFRAKIEEER